MKFLAVLTSPSIYDGCSTWKTFWEGKFTGKEDLFLAVDMKNGGRHNVRKHKEIRGSDKYTTLKKHKDIRGNAKYVTLDISSGFFHSGQDENHIFRVKRKIGKITKGIDYLSGFQDQSKVTKIKKGKVCHRKCQ